MKDRKLRKLLGINEIYCYSGIGALPLYERKIKALENTIEALLDYFKIETDYVTSRVIIVKKGKKK